MPDLIDAILNTLSPESLDLLDKIDVSVYKSSRSYSDALQKSLKSLEDSYYNGRTRELNYKIESYASKARTYKGQFEKYERQLQRFEYAKDYPDHSQKLRNYTKQIENIEKQIREMTKASSAVKLEELFVEVEETFKVIEELELKNKEIQERIKLFENFPTNMREAEYCINDLKERIIKKEAKLESQLYGK